MTKHLSAIFIACLSLGTYAQGLNGTWKGELSAGLFRLPVVINITADGCCTLDSPQQNAKDIPTEVLCLTADSLHISVPSIGASYSARLQNDTLRGTFVQRGSSIPLSMTRGVYEAVRPQTPKPPFPYTTEEVTFTNNKAEATLAGTLCWPAHADRPPVVLMVTGSGQQNRDEEIMLHKPFAVLSDYLARHGIASLRYDDRGFGHSVGGDAKNATTLDLADDAAAGIEWLRSSKRFSQVGILGHSEGGSIAFMLGSRQAVDFIVSLAAPGVQGDSLLLAQNKALLGPLAEMMTIESVRVNSLLSGSAWLRFFIDYNPQPDIAGTTCPVFALNGSRDRQVVASQNLTAINSILPKNSRNLSKEYPELNHLFQHCTTGHPDEYGSIEETIAEEVLDDIANWIKTINSQ